MISTRLLLATLVAGAAALSLPAAAVTFEVNNVVYDSNSGTADGTSNGIGWQMSNSYIWSGASSQSNNSDFTTSYFVPTLSGTDQIHIGGTSFDLSFSQNISSLTLWVRDNNSYGAQFDFGITPTVLSGEIQVSGTAFKASTNGGVVLLSGLNLNTLHSTAGAYDGADVAFSAVAVPEPAEYAMLLAGLGALGLISRRRAGR